jgi:nucleoside-diphosphate-sugar epimerase
MRTVLITGASGVIGRALIDELRDHRVIALVNSDDNLSAAGRVIKSDLGSPRLGLAEHDWQALAEETDVIVHSGALTVWGQPRERYQAINIEGTRTVIELARLAGAPLHVVGTCFVRALELGRLAELSEDNVVAPYIWSKLEAERLVERSGVPYSIFRPTNLIGDSRTGASSRPQIVQLMSDWMCRGKAPFFPAHPGNLIDVVPLDVTAIAIARAVEADDLGGGPRWLTYGADAMTVDEAQDILLEHARDLGRDLDRIPIADPRGALPVPLASVPPMSRTFLKVLIDVSEVTAASGGVLPSSLPELWPKGVPAVSDRDSYRLSLKYWSNEANTAKEAL